MDARASSRFRSIVAAIRLVHVFPTITVIGGAAALMFVAHRGIPEVGVLLRGLTVVGASQVAVGALNDFIDREDDATTQSEKPIPGGQVSGRVALELVALGVIFCCGVALTFGPASLCIAAVGLGSGLAYDLRLKRTPFSPVPYVVSFLSLLTWIWLVFGTLTWTIFIVYPFGALLLLAAHLANALPDVDTDAVLRQRGLAVVLGPRRSLTVTLLISGSAAFCAFALCLLERTTIGLVLSLSSGILVLAAARQAWSTELDRRNLLSIFRCIAPAIGLIAASCLLAFEAAP